MTLTDVAAGVLVVVGLAGIVIPALPGTVLILAAVLLWAIGVSSTTGWVVFGVAAGLLVLGTVVKYAVPGRRLKRGGVATSTLVVGGILGIVGFFVIPVVGLPIGFVLGIYLAEWRRLRRHDLAWPSTKIALHAVGLSILIELTAGLAAAATWVVGLVLV